jgi:AbrB family looped-hinge helix DNA binding protein
MAAMRITTKGQVTIPQDVRERAGLMPGTDVAFEIEVAIFPRCC